MPTENVLYYGDNLEVLRRYIKDETVDLIYLDPPFKSNQDYNVLFAEQDGTRSAAQIKAFTDTWRWDQAAARSYEEVTEKGGSVSLALQALRTFLGTNDMLAYLSMMAPRLVELRRVLKPSGCIYLHCDTTASHYLKLLMDGVFDPANFANEIIWKRSSAHSDSSTCGRAHDTILLYTKNPSEFVWNSQFQPYDATYVSTHYRYRTSEGRVYRTDNLTATGLKGGGYDYEWHGVRRIWRCPVETMQRLEAEGRIHYTRNGVAEYVRYLDEMPGVPLQDLWTDIPPINSQAAERLGYPTQKPEALLERIIHASSNEGDLVLDPFCGCGTAVVVAERLRRRWVGIDITHLAITLIRSRFQDAFNGKVLHKVIGEPIDLEGARALAQEDRYQFQWWALGLVGARPVEQKKGADKGIDGRLYFHEKEGGETKSFMLQVKSGNVSSRDVRDLKGVIDREKAQLGALITLEEPTREMSEEAAAAPSYRPEYRLSDEERYPRIQILTIQEILDGKKLEYPHVRNVTFKKAPEAEVKKKSGSKASSIHEYGEDKQQEE